ncbi:MAG: hypothetical protein O7A03_10395 [Alphaproteobacteria bacterium]|nr:hypothetical protein [Alphaproteobacteria bacterium]
MTRARDIARLAAVCAVLGPLAACAVLEINVDVYKGPLANHQDVQVEQMAAMAIAAKPLLIELRDRLEWGEKAEDIRRQADIARWYTPAFVPKPPRALADAWFQRSEAQRVNAVLSLYRDHDLFGLEDYDRIIRDAKDTFAQARIILAANQKEDKKLWEIVETGFRNNLRTYEEKLKKKYQKFLYINKDQPTYKRREIKGLAQIYAKHLKAKHENRKDITLTRITGQ